MIAEHKLNIFVLLVFIGIPLWAFSVDAPFIITLMTRAAIFALAAVGLNIALGIGGLISFGHAAFFGIGGYIMGILAFHAQTFTPLITFPFEIKGTQNMPIIWLVTLLVSAMVAWGIGVLSLRTRGVYFIMITLAFAQMMYFFFISWPSYGGEDGLALYGRNHFPGLNTFDPIQFYLIVFAFLCGALLFKAGLMQSAFGLALNAARQSPARVETNGINSQRLKLVAFIFSGAITGLAGALFADLNRFVSPAMFSWQFSGEIIVFIIIGGVGRLFGPVIGALVFVTLEHFLGGLSDFWHIYLGLLLLCIVLFSKGGLIGLICGVGRVHG